MLVAFWDGMVVVRSRRRRSPEAERRRAVVGLEAGSGSRCLGAGYFIFSNDG